MNSFIKLCISSRYFYGGRNVLPEVRNPDGAEERVEDH
jgi:hypothetical protein